MKPINIKKSLLPFVLVILSALTTYAQQTLWVGQSYTFDVTSSVMGITANMSWSTNGGYLSLSGSGLYRTITVTQYFSGTATVTCEWDYKLTSSGSYTHTKRQVTISCRDNQVSISPASMTLQPGESSRVSYRHQHDNQYTSNAQAYFQSSDPSICTVSSSGEVLAISPGTTYINVYSKISSVAPYCRVTVEKVYPTSISIPETFAMVGGETATIKPTIYPSNAQTTLLWTSSDSRIAEVNNSGKITALREGTADITVKTENGLTATCKLSVQKGKLKIFSDTPSGFVEKNSVITLSASRPNAHIYYTLDESVPNKSSAVYLNPFVIDKNMVIKAYAVADGFYDSDIETFNYEIRDFTIQKIFPENEQSVNRYAIPAITFNQSFHSGEAFSEISITDHKGNIIPYEAFFGDNQLYICPTKPLSDFTGYHVSIPERALVSNRQEANKPIYWDFNTGSKIVRISYGEENAAIVKSDGSLWVWGQNRYGQLGNGETGTYIVTEPVKILNNVVDVEMSYQRGLALKSDGTVWSWGRNDSGYLGTGNKQDQTKPVQILSNINKIYSGHNTSAAISTDGDLYMWGGNYYGQIGDGSTTTALSPKWILSNVTDVAVRCELAAAIVNGTSIYAWGHNCHKEVFTYGTYGNDVRVTKPWRIGGYSGSAVATTEGNTIYLSNGTVNICGINYHGIFGNGTDDRYITMGFQTPISNIAQIKASEYYIFALDNNNKLWGWGDNKKGQIGVGSRAEILRPSEIISDVHFFTVGTKNAAAILSNGDVYAWGSTEENQLLGHSTASTVYYPTKIFDGPKDMNVESIRLNCPKNIIACKMTTVVVPIVQPSDGSIESIQWMSSNPSVASVDSNGIVKGMSEGHTDIIATIEDKSGNSWNCSLEITVDNSVDVPELMSNENIKIYTQPSKIIVEHSGSPSKIKIYTANGLLIANRDSCSSVEEFPGLSSGLFLVNINGHTEKIVVK